MSWLILLWIGGDFQLSDWTQRRDHALPKDGYCVVEGITHIGNERTLVIWRDCEKVSNEALNEFFRKQAYSTTDSEFDKIYVNGDNTLPNIKTDEEHWKVVLIEEEFKKRMFS